MPDKATIQQLIEFFGFEALKVEGGQFIQTYKSPESLPQQILPPGYHEPHPMGTAILYFYTSDPDSFSAVHKLPTEEIYHYYLGNPVEMLLLFPDGKTERIILGTDVLNGQKVQFIVPRGVWQSSHLLPGGEYALVGTTMAPGFENGDYQGGEREELIQRYPQEADLIRQLTRKDAPLRIE
jgi:predicted cupin superfamily sugar epimerase